MILKIKKNSAIKGPINKSNGKKAKPQTKKNFDNLFSKFMSNRS